MDNSSKRFYRVLLVMAAVGLVAMAVLVAQPIGEEQNLPVAASLDEEASSDLYMSEQAKLARDVSLALYDVWGIRMFSNVARSGQRHMEAVALLIESQGLADPFIGAKPGEFVNSELASLYAELVKQGSQSPKDALLVGAILQDLVIYDLQTYLLEADDPLEIVVYTNLLRGSKNQLRAFSRHLSRFRLSYEARYITQASLEEILFRR